MDDSKKQRDRLVKQVSDEMEELHQRVGCLLSPRVAQALASVPRHEFVPAALQSAAYDDQALPIGWNQTISQPFIVGLMTERLEPQPQHRVLEIGTGSGYQAAVLSLLVQRVFSVEMIPALATAASQRLARLGFDNVEVRQGDGRQGWVEQAPFDGIIVTAAAAELPPALPAQLKIGGRLVAPLGRSPFAQDLCVFQKEAEGRMCRRSLLAVAFVPLV